MGASKKAFDELGLALSVLATSNPAGMGFRLSMMAIGVDMLQGDTNGIAFGVGALTKIKILEGADIIYGIGQVVK